MSAKVISIFSNKGGVGKTFSAVNLATALSLAKNKVLIIDLDFQAGQDMARMLNLTPRSAIIDLLPNLAQLENDPALFQKQVAVHSCGLHFIPAVKNIRQTNKITPEGLKPFLSKVSTLYDFIIIDAGRSFSETLITVFDFSNLLLLLATPDVLAVYQIKACVEVLQDMHFPLKMVKLVLNRSESRGSVAWQEVRSALTCEIFGHIPSDGKAVGLALNRGVPVVLDDPKTKVAEAFMRMAQGLKKDSIYTPAAEVGKLRSTEDLGQPDKFWDKFGVQEGGVSQNLATDSFKEEEDDTLRMKKRIHERLLDRLNIDGVTLENLSDQESILNIKRNAEEVVGNLLVEEVGGRMAAEERMRIVKDIINEALGLGPLEDFLADPDISDIMVNSRNEIYIEKSGKLMLTNKKFISDGKLRAIIDRIIAPLGRRIDESTPMVDARLPDGSRVNAVIPPLSLNGPMVTIRKFASERLGVEDLLNKFHSITREMADFLEAAVIGRKNMIVSGGTGAGKTTLLNMISEFIPEGERIITIEDAAELRLKQSHWARLESRPSNIEGRGQVTIRDLFINTLRMRPDRIIIGECRGPEILDMLQAMNTGHDGSLTTLHANSTRDVLTRMHSMILLSGIELPVRAINEMIGSAIDIIVHINRYSDGTRKITGITEVTGLDSEFHIQTQDIFVFKQKGLGTDGQILGNFEATGILPSCFDELVIRGLNVNKEMFDPSKKTIT